MNKYWIALAACVATLPAEAQTGVALAGVEAGKDTASAYLGTVLSIPGSVLGKGWVQRYWLDYTAYPYEKTPAEEIDVGVAAFEAALGYQGSSATGWWAVYLGAQYSYTELSPNDPSNEERGPDLSAKLQIEGETQLSRNWRINGIASHVVGESSFWTRLRLQTTLDNQLLVGPELIVQGDPNYRLVKLGIFVGGIKVGRDAALTVKLGASRLESGSASGYGGIEWYMPY
jgi:hypothetical protein